MLAGIKRTWATRCLQVKMRAVTFIKADICTSGMMPLNSSCACAAQKCLSQKEGEETAKESIYNQHYPGGLHALTAVQNGQAQSA